MRYFRFVALLPLVLAPGLAVAQEGLAASSASDAVPATVSRLGLTGIEVHDKKHRHRHIEGRLPDGVRVEIDLDRSGEIEEVKARGRTGFTAGSVEPVIPAAVRSHRSYPADARFYKLELHDGRRVEIEGYRPDGSAFEAEFTADGRLIEMKNH